MANKPKLYISPAGHAVDNRTKCPQACSENTHCRAFGDKFAARMRELGADVKVADPKWVGNEGMKKRVAEANKWGAVLYWAIHTNAGGGRYSMTMCWNNAASIEKARVVHKYCKCMAVHKVVTSKVYEIRATKMTCLYDELFFHDNAEDCAWFHTVGMDLLVEEHAQAACELLGLVYVPPVKEQPKEETVKAGDVVKLNKEKLYLSSTGTAGVTRTGTFYLYDGKKVNGRYRVTNKPERVNKKPLALYVSGWVKL